jgi:hypothetical protein
MAVDQPLWPLLNEETAAAVTHYLETGEDYKSVLALKTD